MSYPILKRNDHGEDVMRLQSYLNRVGAMLIPDGDFGSGTKRGVEYAQDIAVQPVTGIADANLWQWLETIPEPFPLLDTNGVAFVAKEETGGLAYYEQVTRWPHFPGEESGITIGAGYDLRFNSADDFRRSWGDRLPQSCIDKLAKDIGKKGSKSRAAELKGLGITVPFKTAWPVFIDRTLPRFYTSTEGIYPSLGKLPGLCRAVLVSIVFNRGTSLSGSKRTEMKEIQKLLGKAGKANFDKEEVKQILSGVEDQIVSMKRLWGPQSGLVARRQAEANLWRKGLAAW